MPALRYYARLVITLALKGVAIGHKALAMLILALTGINPAPVA